MKNHLRFTEAWPPIAVLVDYPNWVYALDEEGKPGQNETTIKPETQQLYVSQETCFTVADVVLTPLHFTASVRKNGEYKSLTIGPRQARFSGQRKNSLIIERDTRPPLVLW
jgi:hypothetical protein